MSQDATAPARPRSWPESVQRDLATLCEEQIPDAPITPSSPQLYREKNYVRRWPFNACVARPVSKKELYATPAAMEARDKEWYKLVEKGVFDDVRNVRF